MAQWVKDPASSLLWVWTLALELLHALGIVKKSNSIEHLFCKADNSRVQFR